MCRQMIGQINLAVQGSFEIININTKTKSWTVAPKSINRLQDLKKIFGVISISDLTSSKVMIFIDRGKYPKR